MSKVPLRCFCHSRVCGIFVLLILLFFGIKFGETTQKVIALVATTFKALLSVTKTNGRLSGHKFYAGNIYYLFENILTHTFPSSAYKKVHPRRNAPKKCFPSNVATQTLSDTVWEKRENTFYQSIFPYQRKICSLCSIGIIPRFTRFVNEAWEFDKNIIDK